MEGCFYIHDGGKRQNGMLDLVTPHTVRRGVDRFWEIAPQQIASLLEQFGKPVSSR